MHQGLLISQVLEFMNKHKEVGGGAGTERQVSRTESSLQSMKGETLLQPEQQSNMVCLFHLNFIFP